MSRSILFSRLCLNLSTAGSDSAFFSAGLTSTSVSDSTLCIEDGLRSRRCLIPHLSSGACRRSRLLSDRNMLRPFEQHPPSSSSGDTMESFLNRVLARVSFRRSSGHSLPKWEPKAPQRPQRPRQSFLWMRFLKPSVTPNLPSRAWNSHVGTTMSSARVLHTIVCIRSSSGLTVACSPTHIPALKTRSSRASVSSPYFTSSMPPITKYAALDFSPCTKTVASLGMTSSRTSMHSSRPSPGHKSMMSRMMPRVLSRGIQRM
mmetsp:Transcript_18703/g.52847  ORF Transcript_18703/g.52847 Transcript_18703/m.52847 type:complete len:260 (-) Transcript_18703:918-1697(-)